MNAVALSLAQKNIIDILDEQSSYNTIMTVPLDDAMMVFPECNQIDIKQMNQFLRAYGYRVVERLFVPGPYGSRYLTIAKVKHWLVE